jgi:hypothetical protein
VNLTRSTVLVACVVFALASARSWAETKSGFNLNPFAKSTAASKPKTNSSGFKLPSLWPASEQKKVTKRSTEPSAWDKFSSESKAMLDKTTDAITFWDNDKPAAKSHAPDSVRNRFGVKKKEEEKKSFFSGWFSSKEEEPSRPRTVSEFLNQDKPQP